MASVAALCCHTYHKRYRLGKSTSGPDWVDVLMYLQALDLLHGCTTGFTFTSTTRPASFAATVFISSVWDVLPGSSEPLLVKTEQELATHELRDLAAAVYNGLYTHDFAIGKAYKQNGWSPPEEH